MAHRRVLSTLCAATMAAALLSVTAPPSHLVRAVGHVPSRIVAHAVPARIVAHASHRTSVAVASTGALIQRVFTDKARYAPGANATIYVPMQNTTGATWSGSVTLTVTHLEGTVYTASQNVTLSASQALTPTFTWTPPATDFQGYGLQVTAGTVDSASSALDVSSTWTHFPRYGFMDTFAPTETPAQSQALIAQLAQTYHIDAYQMYDWSWRHEQLLQRTNGQINSSWTDWSGRVNSWTTLLNQIAAIHGQNGAALSYMMSYGARDGYQQVSGVDPSWGLYTDTAHQSQWNFAFGTAYPGEYLFMFNPANTNWQSYIANQYQDAVTNAGFDGLQMDQLGEHDNLYDYNGQPSDLGNNFASLINAVKRKLPNTAVTFNMVNGGVGSWAENNVSRYAKTDFNYSEIWDNSPNYQDLYNTVTQYRANTANKATVLAGYMNYYEDSGPSYEAENAALTGVSTSTTNPGYTGSGYVYWPATSGTSVQFTVSVPESGKYAFDFRYANGSGANATRNLYIDGANAATLTFLNQSSGWGSWQYDAYDVATLTPGTHTITLQYDNGNSGQFDLDNLVLGAFDPNAVRLADAAMAASGAYHIELGEGDQMLAHPYFVNNYKQMRSGLRAAIKNQYDFITSYENLLYDKDIQPTDEGAQWVNIAGEPTSGTGAAGTIWTVLRHTANYDVVHLVNLLGQTSTVWRSSKNTPATVSNLPVKYYLGANESVGGVYVASPDAGGGATTTLSYTIGSDAGGPYISFTVPSLQYWDMVYVKRTITAPTGGVYEAETAVRTNVTVNTNHAGYTGTGFVDGFTSQGAGVSFVVTVPTTDSYTLAFRYANATGSAASRTVYVDGQNVGDNQAASQVSLGSTSTWDNWGTVTKVVRLTPGVHTVVLLYTSSDSGSINLDNLQVTEQTAPSTTSAASLYLSNWKDTMALWMASKLNQNDTGTYGPRIGELHYSANWGTNQIVDYSGFFRDETNNVKYDQIHNFAAQGYDESNGTLTSNYLTYNGAALPVRISRDYAMVPNQNILVVKYAITNTTSAPLTYNLLDQVHLNNVQKGSGTNEHASYDGARNALFADMSPSGQYYVALGAFAPVDSYQAGNDGDSNTADATSGSWYQFDASGSLKDNANLTTPDVDLAMQKRVALAANGSATVYFYLTVQGSLSAAQSAADAARAQTGDYWFGQTASSYNSWLASGSRPNLPDTGVDTAFDRNLIVIKNAQNPTIGGFPAATNPASYGYKVWARDSALTAQSLDATGHTAEADKYWRWLASVQNADGTFHTTFDLWSGAPVSFVEPEDDSLGMFLGGTYRHYLALGSNGKAFLDAIWPQLRLSADWIQNNINGTTQLGAADNSIWEENVEYNTFTQALYAYGLDAAQYMARAEGDTTRADSYSGAASTIVSSIQRSSEWSTPGLWNDANRYYNRAVTTGNAARTTVDSSSDALVAFGVLDPASARMQDHIIKVLSTITHDSWGLARYAGDTYYYTSQYSPAGNEALAAEPTWPQMSMYVALYEMATGQSANALARLQWYASRSGVGYMPPGEATSWVNGQPIVSTMSEPLTAAAFLMTVLAYQHQYTIGILPPQYNAGANKTINVTTNAAADWPQWDNVPYYLDKTGDSVSGSSMTDIKRVYVSNDATNIYVRIDNAGGTLSGYNTEPKFAMMVYSEDYNHNPSTPSLGTGYFGGTLDRPMQYLVARWSDSTTFSRFKVVNGAWTFDSAITGVTAPQWDTTTGRMEMVIPISALTSSGSVGQGTYANFNVALAYHNAGTNTWTDDDILPIHYRLTTSGVPWLFGNSD